MFQLIYGRIVWQILPSDGCWRTYRHSVSYVIDDRIISERMAESELIMISERMAESELIMMVLNC
jgi:hypothetical protein